MVWLPAKVKAVNAALAAGTGEAWRTDPIQVLARQPEIRDLVDMFRSPGYHRRFGLCVLDQSENMTVVSSVNQEVIDEPVDFADPSGPQVVAYHSHTERFTLERLGGGPGWWITHWEGPTPSELENEYSVEGPRMLGDTGRAAIDALLGDCSDVLVDQL